MAGDTVRADYVFDGNAHFAFWALLRPDSLIVVAPMLGRVPEFPPLVRDREDD